MPPPTAFFVAGWNLVRKDTSIFAARFVADLFATALRLGTAFAIGLLVTLHLGNHVKGGGDVLSWVPMALERFTSLPVMAALAGLFLAAWAIAFTAQALAGGGIWGVLADGVRGAEVTPWRSTLRRAPRAFSRAVGARALTTLVDITLLTALVGLVMGGTQLAAGIGEVTQSHILLPAILLAMIFAVYSVAAGLIRLTTELVAAPMFIRDASLGESMLQAASLVLKRPVYAYRLFVQSSAVLIAPLFLYWLALFGQQLSLGSPRLAAIGGVVRILADLVLLGGIGAFVVMLHASFFAYFGWAEGLLALPSQKSKMVSKSPSLDDLAPKEWPHVVNVADILRPWDEDEVEPPPAPGTSGPRRDFDLDAILGPMQGKGEKN